MMLGADEQFLLQHQVSDDLSLALGRLSVVLEWKSGNENVLHIHNNLFFHSLYFIFQIYNSSSTIITLIVITSIII